MFFQITPPRRKPTLSVQKSKDSPKEPTAVLSLAPFTAAPKICFDGIKLGSTASRQLLIKNPSPYIIDVSIAKIPTVENEEVLLSWNKTEIPACGDCLLEISWTPQVIGVWRDVLRINNELKNIKRDIYIVFKSVSAPKIKKTGVRVQNENNIRPTFVCSKVRKSLSPQDKLHFGSHSNQRILTKKISPLKSEKSRIEHNLYKRRTLEIQKKELRENKNLYNVHEDLKNDISRLVNVNDYYNTPSSRTQHKFMNPLRENYVPNRTIRKNTFNISNGLSPSSPTNTFNDSLENVPDNRFDDKVSERIFARPQRRVLNQQQVHTDLSMRLNSQSFCFTPCDKGRSVQQNGDIPAQSIDSLSARLDTSEFKFTPAKCSDAIKTTFNFTPAQEQSYDFNNTNILNTSKKSPFDIKNRSTPINQTYEIASISTTDMNIKSQPNSPVNFKTTENASKFIFNNSFLSNCGKLSPILGFNHSAMSICTKDINVSTSTQKNFEINYSGRETKHIIEANLWSDTATISPKNYNGLSCIQEETFPTSSEGYTTYNGGLKTKLFNRTPDYRSESSLRKEQSKCRGTSKCSLQLGFSESIEYNPSCIRSNSKNELAYPTPDAYSPKNKSVTSTAKKQPNCDVSIRIEPPGGSALEPPSFHYSSNYEQCPVSSSQLDYSAPNYEYGSTNYQHIDHRTIDRQTYHMSSRQYCSDVKSRDPALQKSCYNGSKPVHQYQRNEYDQAKKVFWNPYNLSPDVSIWEEKSRTYNLTNSSWKKHIFQDNLAENNSLYGHHDNGLQYDYYLKPSQYVPMDRNLEHTDESLVYNRSVKRKAIKDCYATSNISPPSKFTIQEKSRLNSKTWNKVDVRKIKAFSLRSQQNRLPVSKPRALEKSIRLDNPDKLLVNMANPDPFAASMTIDPFLSSTLYYNDSWVEKQEQVFKKWLNALLTPPADLESKTEIVKVDVAKIWMESRNKKLFMAPSKETVSSLYHTSYKLNFLRKRAGLFFKSPDISQVLMKVVGVVEQDQFTIREDRNLHVDLGLQAEIMRLLLSYNPLWLRIGLETIYGETIPLVSNSDVVGLSTFIMLRLFMDPYLRQKHAIPNVRNSYQVSYAPAIKRFTLKKFLILVYFLDQAKLKKLIVHDPCLFCLNAPVKESRELLLSFSRELLAGIGDITKNLRRLGYILSYKQGALDEFQYAVKNVGIDLRDGIRLTKIMEIILLKDNLSHCLRVPAISKLQKVHNVKVALDALNSADFKLLGDIKPKDIVEGHREKTLSLLWQIIYKFRAPIFGNAATTIKHWWKSLRIVIARRIRIKARRIELFKLQNRAALIIQRFLSAKVLYIRYIRLKYATVTIQRWYRSLIVTRQLRKNFLKIRFAAIIIQRSFRRVYMKRLQQKYLEGLIPNVLILQQRLRATLLMRKERLRYIKTINAIKTIQTRFRKFLQMRKQRSDYLRMKDAICKLQRRYRATVIMRKEYRKYIEKLNAVKIIQTKLRATLLMRRQRWEFLRHISFITVIQQRYRANSLMRKQRARYIEIVSSTIRIQRYFRATLLMRHQRTIFLQKRNAACLLQRRLRATLQMRLQMSDFRKTIQAIQVIQRRWRSTILMRLQRTEYLKILNASITIQHRLRATLLMRRDLFKYLHIVRAVKIIQNRMRATWCMQTVRAEYIEKIEAIRIIQDYFRAVLCMRAVRDNYLKTIRSVKLIQQRWRSTLLMRKQRTEYQNVLRAIRTIQTRLRATLMMRNQRFEYSKVIASVQIIQQRWRATLLKRKQRDEYLKAVRLLQERFRATLLMRKQRCNYIKTMRAIVTIQRRLRANILMRKQRDEYLRLCKVTRILQERFRATIHMKKQRSQFIEIIKVVRFIQNRFRATFQMRKQRRNYLEILKAVQIIQERFRATQRMKEQRCNYIAARSAITTIQHYWKVHLIQRKQRSTYLNTLRVIKLIQVRFRSKLVMREERYKYVKIVRAVYIIQQRYRATLIMRKVRAEYLLTLQAVRILQQHLRATLLMKQQQSSYLKTRVAIKTLQKRLRATVLMWRQREGYIKIISATRIIQVRYRATIAMRNQRSDYLKVLKSVQIIQQRIRAVFLMRKQRTEYLKIIKATRIIQERFRATRLMRDQRSRYLRTLSAAVVIQERYKATHKMRRERAKYLSTVKVVRKFQEYFRASLLMRRQRSQYMQILDAVRKIQTQYRCFIQMRQQRQVYLTKINAICVLQRYFRATLHMRKQREAYMKTRQAIITIQVRYRLTLLMRKQRAEFLSIITAVLTIQRRRRGQLLMRKERNRYIQILHAVRILQEYFRKSILMLQERRAYMQLKTSVILMQRRYRATQLMRFEREQFLKKRSERLKEIKRKRRLVYLVTKVQAIWRGYRARKSSTKRMKAVRIRSLEAQENASEENTLGYRCAVTIDAFIASRTINSVIIALTDLDYLTRLCPTTCEKYCYVIVERITTLLAASNRSLPHKEACELAVSVLINLVTYPVTAETVIQYFDIENAAMLLSIMGRWADKSGLLFPYLCTLVWLLCQDVQENLVFRGIPNYEIILRKIHLQTSRMLGMQDRRTKSVLERQKKILPNTRFAWGIFRLNAPRTFEHPGFAIENVLHCLNIPIYE